MNTFKRILRYENTNTKNSTLGFLLVMIVMNVLFYLMNHSPNFINNIGLTSGELLSVVGINFLPMGLFLLLHTYNNYYEAYSLTSSFNIVKSDFYGSLVLDNILMVGIMSLVQGILIKLDPIVISLIGKTPLYDLGFTNTQTDNVFFIIVSLFVSFMFIMGIFNIMAALNYKFGRKIWIVYIGLIVGLNYIVESKINIWLGQYFTDIAMNERLTFISTGKYLILTLITYGITYFIVKNTKPR